MKHLDGYLVIGLVVAAGALTLLDMLLGVLEVRLTRCAEQQTTQVERLTSCTSLLERTTEGLRDCGAVLSRVRDLDAEQACVCFDPLPLVLETP
jgi:hypothetical protein